MMEKVSDYLHSPETMKAAETRQKILDSAVLLVSEKGYLGATTREIAQGAGVTELTLFRHFGSKERLFESLLGRQSFLPALKEILPNLDGMPYEEALVVLGRQFLRSLKERKPFVKIMQAEMTRHPAKIKRIYSQLMDDMLGTLAAYFRAMQRKGELRRFPPELAARMFLGMLSSYFRTEELMRGRDITKEKEMRQVVSGFVDIFVRGTLVGPMRPSARRRAS
jgi:AcrR family transcriptional regulator